MKLMIASDIHGSAFYCRKMLEAYKREDADRLLLLGDILYHGPRNDLPKDYNPKEVIAMSSGMAVGAGKSGCVCGAFNGGLLALGMFFGRTEQDGPTNPKSVKCMELVHELHDWFKKANGKNAICCRVLTKEFNMGQGEHKEQCIFFTGLCAWKVAQIVCRELGIKNLDEIDEPAERRAIADI